MVGDDVGIDDGTNVGRWVGTSVGDQVGSRVGVVAVSTDVTNIQLTIVTKIFSTLIVNYLFGSISTAPRMKHSYK